MSKTTIKIFEDEIFEIRNLLDESKKTISTTINTTLLTTNWKIGEIIVKYEEFTYNLETWEADKNNVYIYDETNKVYIQNNAAYDSSETYYVRTVIEDENKYLTIEEITLSNGVKYENVQYESVLIDNLESYTIDLKDIKNKNISRIIAKDRTDVSAQFSTNYSIESLEILAYENTINVCFNYEDGFENVVRHVIEEHGCRKLHMMAGLKDNDFSERRIDVFKKVLSENNIPFSNSMISYGEF